ncbi:hypothetical protein L1887_54389 [Cichorium endivia]|nr:hypothetical protein L1887_54389 [Cichorium endivia]
MISELAQAQSTQPALSAESSPAGSRSSAYASEPGQDTLFDNGASESERDTADWAHSEQSSSTWHSSSSSNKSSESSSSSSSILPPRGLLHPPSLQGLISRRSTVQHDSSGSHK